MAGRSRAASRSEDLEQLKRTIGLILFWASWLLWLLMLMIPLLVDRDAESVALIVTSLLIAAEVSFALSLLLLGKPFYQAFKAKVKRFWKRNGLARQAESDDHQ